MTEDGKLDSMIPGSQ